MKNMSYSINFKEETMKKGYLVLQDGRVFEGFRFGAETDSIGELVFTTGTGGYIETLTDPSFAGEIILHTYPLIGNYGIIEEDFEGKCLIKGCVVREWCEAPSNFRTQYDLDTFLKNNGVPGLWGVDTRELTRIIRENGVMNAMICSEVPADLTAIETYAIAEPVKYATCASISLHNAVGEEKFRVSLVDYGVRRSLIRTLQSMGCTVTVYPASVTAEDILAGKPDGVVLSDGPGDPAANEAIIAELSKLLGKVPMMAVGLGHQMLALAAGGQTEKLKAGHHGANQPAKDLLSGRTYITAQSHCYVVSEPGCGTVRFVNANDNTCEGVDYPDHKAFGVQFTPDAPCGLADSSFLYDCFAELMKGGAN